MQKKKCIFYPKCTKGDQCQFLHSDVVSMPNTPKATAQPTAKVCTYFKQGNCNKNPCNFFHPPGAQGQVAAASASAANKPGAIDKKDTPKIVPPPSDAKSTPV